MRWTAMKDILTEVELRSVKELQAGFVVMDSKVYRVLCPEPNVPRLNAGGSHAICEAATLSARMVQTQWLRQLLKTPARQGAGPHLHIWPRKTAVCPIAWPGLFASIQRPSACP